MKYLILSENSVISLEKIVAVCLIIEYNFLGFRKTLGLSITYDISGFENVVDLYYSDEELKRKLPEKDLEIITNKLLLKV